MEKKKTTIASRIIGLIGLYQVLVIGLKLVGILSWSWTWILFPLLFQLLIFAGFFFYKLTFGNNTKK